VDTRRGKKEGKVMGCHAINCCNTHGIGVGYIREIVYGAGYVLREGSSLIIAGQGVKINFKSSPIRVFRHF